MAQPGGSPDATLHLRDIEVSYGASLALGGVTADVLPGTVVGVIGPNGSGKSTLLKAIAGVLSPSRGTIRLGAQDIRERAAQVAFVPQREEVNWDFPVTARDVVLMGRYRSKGWLRWPGAADRRMAESALERLGLSGMGDRHISQFSGGQQQRIFLARAMVQEPLVVLLDEPFTGVDVTNRKVFHETIQEFARRGIIVMIATHELGEVQETTDFVMCLNRRMVAFGPTPATYTPENLRATFGGQVAVFEASR
ncbi:MAG: manganese ABC transporter ATP-binding protein [Anaerolinea sp.]|nr:manganese ABC transporter ATP-binding protein [Anaerolinea sp.]